MTAPHSPPTTPKKIEINPIQVIAAALAAVTAAVIGSRLGIAGTLLGAAGASVTLNVGTAVYRASLEHSQQRIRALAHRTRPLPTHGEDFDADRSPPTANGPLGDDQPGAGTDPGSQPGGRSRLFTRLRWGAMTVGALGGFVLAMMLITGYEWASGGTLGGHGEGTTIGKVVNAPPRAPDPAPPAPSSSVPTSETTPTTTSSVDPSAEQSPSPTTGTPTPSDVEPTPPLIPTRLPGIGG